MKKAVKQSTLIVVLSGTTIFMVLMIALLFLVGAYPVLQRQEEALKERYEITQQSSRLLNASWYLTKQARAYINTGQEEHMRRYEEELVGDRNREGAVETLEGLLEDEEELRQIEQMYLVSESLVSLDRAAFDQVDAQGEQAQSLVYGEDYLELAERIAELQAAFAAGVEERTEKVIDSIESDKRRGIAVLGGWMALTCIVQMVAAHITRRRVIRPLLRVEEEMNRLAQGNLSSPVELEPDSSEIGMLVGSMIRTKKEMRSLVQDISHKLTAMSEGDMNLYMDAEYAGDFIPIEEAMKKNIESINYMLREIDESTNHIDAGANQIAGAGQIVAQGVAEQANSVMELNETIKEVSGQMQRLADSASQTTAGADTAIEELQVSDRKMWRMMEAMEVIDQTSRELQRIVAVIDEIAFQTSILSLNAAVEAARSGQYGKGFAVVADEVRNLAAKSAAAVEDARKMIDRNINAVETGQKFGDDTAASLKQVLSMAGQVNTAMKTVSSAVDTNLVAIDQIRDGVDQISAVVQSNSSTAEESAAASEDLAAQAQKLKLLVARFRLRSGSGSGIRATVGKPFSGTEAEADISLWVNPRRKAERL